jgi:hypothetical protein
MIRTCNLLIRSEMLYPLSYERLSDQCTGIAPASGRVMWVVAKLAEKEGFEPSDPLAEVPSLAVRWIRPLSHFSIPGYPEREFLHITQLHSAGYSQSALFGLACHNSRRPTNL